MVVTRTLGHSVELPHYTLCGLTPCWLWYLHYCVCCHDSKLGLRQQQRAFTNPAATFSPPHQQRLKTKTEVVPEELNDTVSIVEYLIELSEPLW